jgi:hypothetical protein
MLAFKLCHAADSDMHLITHSLQCAHNPVMLQDLKWRLGVVRIQLTTPSIAMPPPSFSLPPGDSISSPLTPSITMEQALAAAFAANRSMNPADLLKVGSSFTDAWV